MTRHVVNFHTDHPGIYTRCFHGPVTDGEWLVSRYFTYLSKFFTVRILNGGEVDNYSIKYTNAEQTLDAYSYTKTSELNFLTASPHSFFYFF